jgi:H+-transporting ATPase
MLSTTRLSRSGVLFDQSPAYGTTASGEKFWATKGAPPVVLKMCHDYNKIGEQVEAMIDNLGERGIRSLAVAVTKNEHKEGRWYFVGMLTFLDPPRPDTKLTIERAHELGVSVKMVTGDQLKIAKETCRTLGMGTSCFGTEVLPKTAATATREQKHLIEDAHAFAGVFPEHKHMIMQVLQRGGYNCGMTGDGVNDAPALKKADVGIAVQGATDAARAASDIVLTDPGLSPIITAINISRQIFQRIQIYLCYRIVASVMIAAFFFVSVIIGNISKYTDCIKCECHEFGLTFANGTFNPDCTPCTHGSMRLEHVMCYNIETSQGSVIVDSHQDSDRAILPALDPAACADDHLQRW